MIRRLLLLAIAAAVAAPVAAQQPPPPKLVVIISVDQYSSAMFEEYRPQMTEGLARLALGTVFLSGSGQPARSALGDLMKAHWPSSRNVVVSGNQADAGASGGRNVDQRWYWSGVRFQTDLKSAPVPPVVSKVNSAILSALSQPRPGLEATPYCQSKAPAGAQVSKLGRAPGDSATLAASPELDGDTLALAAGLVDQMQLGKHAQPDLLSVDLSATGNVARAHGQSSEEMCLQLTELDREIGDFLSLLDARGIDYALSLKGIPSEAGGGVPILFWRPGFQGATINSEATISDMVATLSALIELPVDQASSDGRCLDGTPAFCPR